MRQLTRFGTGSHFNDSKCFCPQVSVTLVLFLKDSSEWRGEVEGGQEEKNGGFRDACSTKGFTKGLKQDEH